MTMWRWVFQETADPTTVGELDTLTSPHFKARSNGLKLFTGMLGRAPTEQDDTDTLIGQEFDVVFGPNQAGQEHRHRGHEALRSGPYAAGSGSVARRPMARSRPFYAGYFPNVRGWLSSPG